MMRFGLPRNYLVRLGCVFGLSAASFLLAAPPRAGMPADAFVLFTQGGAFYTPDVYLPALIFGALPFLALCYAFCDFLNEDRGRVGAYIFTRKEKRAQWFAGKAALLFFGALTVYAALFWMLACVQLVADGAGDGIGQLGPALRLFVPVVLLNTLFAGTFLLAINLLALRIGALRAFIAVSAFHLFSLFTCMSLPGGLRGAGVHITPSAQGVFAWHDAGALPDASAYGLLGECAVPDFFLMYSYAYLIVMGAVAVLIGLLVVRRMDVL